MCLFTEATFSAIDFETANRQWQSACSIGIVIIRHGEIVHKYSTLIQPPQNLYDPDFIAIHGIVPEQTLTAPAFPEVWPTIQELLSGHLVVAHNASFDMKVLRSTLSHYNLNKVAFNYFCSVQLARRVWPSFSSHSLGSLAQKLDLQFSHHQADEDAWACSQIVLKAYEKKEAHNMPDLLKQCSLTVKAF